MMSFSILLFLTQAFAGGSVVSNGGTYVECSRAPQTSSIYSQKKAIFDIFQGQEYWGFHYKRLASFRGQSFEKAFPKAVHLFFSRSPETEEHIMQNFADFSKYVIFVDDLPSLGNGGNFSWTTLRMGCDIKQAAIQYVQRNSAPDSKVLIKIDRKLWKNLETDQKISLMIHEYVQAIYVQYVGACVYHLIHQTVANLLSDESFELSHSEWSAKFWFQCDGLGPQ